MRGDPLTLLKGQNDASMLVRASDSLLDAIRAAAQTEEMSMNAWVVRCLATAVGFQRREITKVIGHVWEAPASESAGSIARSGDDAAGRRPKINVEEPT